MIQRYEHLVRLCKNEKKEETINKIKDDDSERNTVNNYARSLSLVCFHRDGAYTSVCFNRLQNRNDVLRAFLPYISVISIGKKKKKWGKGVHRFMSGIIMQDEITNYVAPQIPRALVKRLSLSD